MSDGIISMAHMMEYAAATPRIPQCRPTINESTYMELANIVHRRLMSGLPCVLKIKTTTVTDCSAPSGPKTISRGATGIQRAPRKTRTKGTAITARPNISGKVANAKKRNGIATGVRQMLKAHGKSMKVGEIYNKLVAAGYAFSSSNPKNSLTAQMYRMKGVKRTGAGEFRAA